MSYKRLETYIGWTCNHKCTYCMEFPSMEDVWNKKVTKQDILKTLLKYKKNGYNHCTFLGGEPFIQPVFLDALKLGKKLGYTILVTTNCTTLHLESQAKKFLPYIDELILSFNAIDKESQQKICRTNSMVDWNKVFENIKNFWNGKYLKINTVITKDNLNELFNIVEFSFTHGIKNVAITYPDLDLEYYGENHIKNRVAPKYCECVAKIMKIVEFCEKNNINLKLPDFPFCVFPSNNLKKFIKLTDDYDYETRIKLGHEGNIYDRNIDIPRRRRHIQNCDKCYFKKKCWGVSTGYGKIYGYNEIQPIIIN